MKEFLNKHKVFITGLLQFVLTTVVELTSGDSGNYSPYIIGYSALVAALTFAGRNLRGQWASISGALLSSVMVFGGLHDSQIPITWAIVTTRMVLPFSLALLSVFYTSPPKDRDYEHSETIVAAKQEGKAITEAKKNA